MNIDILSTYLRCMDQSILIIDDEKDIRNLLAKTLEYENYNVVVAESGKVALKLLKESKVFVAICDVKLSDSNGVELTRKIKELSPQTEVICLTAYGTIHDGVQAMKNGAFDYLIKGDDSNKLLPSVSKAWEKAVLQFRVKELEEKIVKKYSFDEVIGKSPLISEAIQMAKKVAPSDTTVLLSGATGTGKEVFAHAIHSASPRKQQPFVAVNCGAFSRELLESEMFGYKPGAFTGASKEKKGLLEEAHRGTIFLDEIGELDQDLQAKLLRVLETGTFIKVGGTKEVKVNVRIIAATNRDLRKEVMEGRFREDLFYRLSVFEIRLPSLNERKEDIPELAQYFVNQFAIKSRKKITEVSETFIEVLRKHQWKGNIRELRNIIERAVILCDSEVLTPDLLPNDFEFTNTISTSLYDIKEVESRHIKNILRLTNGNKTKAANLLGIGLTTLYRKLEEYKISSDT